MSQKSLLINMNQGTQEIRVRLYKYEGSNDESWSNDMWNDVGTGFFSYLKTEETDSYINNYEIGLLMVIKAQEDG